MFIPRSRHLSTECPQSFPQPVCLSGHPVATAQRPLAMAPVAMARAPVAKARALRSGDQKRAPLPIVIVYIAGQHVVPP